MCELAPRPPRPRPPRPLGLGPCAGVGSRIGGRARARGTRVGAALARLRAAACAALLSAGSAANCTYGSSCVRSAGGAKRWKYPVSSWRVHPSRVRRSVRGAAVSWMRKPVLRPGAASVGSMDHSPGRFAKQINASARSCQQELVFVAVSWPNQCLPAVLLAGRARAGCGSSWW